MGPQAGAHAPNPGRDYSPTAYSVWLAGGGVRGGRAIGAIDDVGYTVLERQVDPNDLHATILHARGIDQYERCFEYHNRQELVTVNGAHVVGEAFG